jgi:predicted molibdopterin-dependent oxidoreductase YjgC
VGRYSYKCIDDPSRITVAQFKQEGQFEPLKMDEAIKLAGEKLKASLEEDGKDSIVVLTSPQLTNEDFFVTRKFFGEDIGLSQIDFRIPEKNPSVGDDFLLRADRNPNTRGAEAILLDENGFDLSEILPAENQKKFHLLFLFERDLQTALGESWARSFLNRFDYRIYVGSHENQTSLAADLILPSASYAETEGTFTNFEGRVQKINQAVEPLGDSLPFWQIISQLARSLGYDFCYDSAEEVFAELAQRVFEFEDLTYDRVGSGGVQLLGASKVRVES